MNIKKYIKLKESFEKDTFEAKYSTLNKLMYLCSFLGNTGSIFFASFFLSTILYRATDEFNGRGIVITVVSIIALTLFELLKRNVFTNLSTSQVKNKKLTSDLVTNIIFSLILISGSFYSSLSGAQIFADKKDTIVLESKENISMTIDSIKLSYNNKIDYKTSERNTLINNRELYVSKIKDIKITSRLNQMNELITKATEELRRIDMDIESIQNERDSVIRSLREEINIETSDKIKHITQNQFVFILLSSFIEFLILVGIYFHVFYNYRTYIEFKENIENSLKYDMFVKYQKLLKILYNNGSINYKEQLPTNNTFFDLAKSSGEYTIAYLRTFLSTCESIGIIKISGKHKIASKNYEDATKSIIGYFSE